MTKAKADPGPLGIRLEATRAWLTLGDALTNMEDHGRGQVCATSPDDGSADARPAVRAQAADACTWCPAQPPCLAFAIATPLGARVPGRRRRAPSDGRAHQQRVGVTLNASSQGTAGEGSGMSAGFKGFAP